MINFFGTENLTQNEKLDDAGHITAKFYATSGEKCKIIGTQDGGFPEFGHHVRLEMGGVWVHPIKLLDGFWTKLNGQWMVAEKYQTLPYANKFYFTCGGLSVVRTQFAPDSKMGAVVRLEIENKNEASLPADIETAFKFDLSPVWNSEKLGISDGEDEANTENGIITAKDALNEWHAAIGFSAPTDEIIIGNGKLLGPAETVGKGTWAASRHSLCVDAKSTVILEYYISGSWHSKDEALSENKYLKLNANALLQEKIDRYRKVYERSRLVTSDMEFNKAYEWIKYNNEWLIQDSGEFGRAAMAGIPEYTWWFGCDNSYSLQGIMALGDFELAKDTIILLCESSERKNGNGRIVHEITTYGEISNPGNTQETAHYITAVYKYYKWTGDKQTLRRVYQYCKLGLSWLLNEMDEDGDLLPSGYGIIEIAGLNIELIDTAVYTCQALFCMHELSKEFGEENTKWLEDAQALRAKLNNELFLESEGLYAEAVGTPRQLIERVPQIKRQYGSRRTETSEYFDFLDAYVEKLEKLDPDKEIPFIVNRSWVINTPMETGLADEGKAQTALKVMRSPEFVNHLGLYLSGYTRDSVMTISTGVQAVAEGRYKNADEALELVEKMSATMGEVMPGSINEMCPDYGCFTQEWTVYGMLVPVVECFAGISANAPERAVDIAPCIPSKWSSFSLTNVKVGSNTISLEYNKTNNGERYYFTSDEDWKINFTAKSDNVFVNGKKRGQRFTLGEGTHCIEVIL